MGYHRRKFDYEEIAKDWLSGMPIHDIAEKHGTSMAYVRFLRTRLGLPPRKLGGSRKRGTGHASRILATTWAPRIPDMQQMINEGKTLEEMGQLYGVTRERIRQALTAFGITDRGQRHRAKVTEVMVCKVCAASYLAGEYRAHVKAAGHPIKEEAMPGRSQAIVEAYLKGERVADIARKWDMRPPSIFPILKRHGVEKNRNGGRYVRDATTLKRLSESLRGRLADRDAARRPVVRELLAKGYTKGRIAQETGFHSSTIDRLVRQINDEKS